MVTPASLYILRSALNLSIDTDVRHAFSFSAASRCAACCSGEASPRPRPPPAPPPRAAGGASPRGAALQGCPAQDALNCGGGASAPAAPRPPPRAPPPPPPPRPPPAPPPPAPPPRPEAGAPAKLSTEPPINSIALMPESTTYLSVASAL